MEYNTTIQQQQPKIYTQLDKIKFIIGEDLRKTRFSHRRSVEVAVESDTEVEQLVVDILWCRGADGVARDVDTDMGAAGGEDAHTAIDVGIGRDFLARGGIGFVRGHVCL